MPDKRTFRLYVRIAGEPVSLQTDHPAYFTFLKEYFRAAVCAEVPVRVHTAGFWIGQGWGDLKDQRRDQAGVSQIAGHTFAGGSTCSAFIKINRRWKSWIDVEHKDRVFCSTVTFKHDPQADFWKYALLRASSEDYFYQITYPVFYYPVFRALELFSQRYLLHASGINAGGQGIIFCGMEGIGKTSLVLGLLGTDARFVSDNLLFYDPGKIYPCYETVRVHADGARHDWEDGFERLTQFKSCKDFFVPRVTGDGAAGVVPRVLIFPQFGAEFTIAEIDAASAARRAINLSYCASELAQYAQYRRLYDIMDGGCVPEIEQFGVLSALLGKVRSFVITMPKKDGLKTNVARVRAHLAGLGLPV